MTKAATYHSIPLLKSFDVEHHLKEFRDVKKLIDPTYHDTSVTDYETD